MADAGVAAARHAWEDGLIRLTPLIPAGGNRMRIVTAVHDELRRRVGTTFRLADLARVYDGASTWYLELAARLAPREPEVWDSSVTLDGAFGLYQRFATDACG